MILLRSTLFNVLFHLWILGFGVVTIPLMVMPRACAVAATQRGAWLVLELLRLTAGIRWRVVGEENVPSGPVIIAAKHQSSWDTFIFHLLSHDPAYILKQELFRLPFYGWIAWKLGMIGIDRSGGGAALKDMTARSLAAIKEGRRLIIFPQGTRTPAGSGKPYLPGTFSIYRAARVPVVPVALNSGTHWPRHGYLKRPGTITVEYLPAIPPGLDRKTFMRLLEETIEGASARLDS